MWCGEGSVGYSNHIAGIDDSEVFDFKPDQNPSDLGSYLTELLHDLDEPNGLTGGDGVTFIYIRFLAGARLAIKNPGKR